MNLALLLLSLPAANAVSYSSAMEQAARATDNGDLAGELTGYVQAVQAAPDSGPARSALLAMIAGSGMPHAISQDQIAVVQSATDPFSCSTPDPGVTLVGLSGASGRSLDTVSDPQNQWPFPAMIAAYTSSGQDAGRSVLICTVHYQTDDDRDFAEHAARLLALLRNILIKRTGQMPAFESPINVWLSRSASTTPGGEQWRNNIYLYNLADGRSSIEWVREIAHEYSHLAIPALGGAYTAPEAWANGYVGERLLVRWLADPNLAGQSVVEHVWGRPFSGYVNFKSKLIDPPINTFISVGFDRPTLDRTDATGMKYLIGMLLWVDANRGGKALGTLLWNLDASNPDALFAPMKVLNPPVPPHGRRVTL